MAFYTGIVTRPITAYHRSSSLLLQFILTEFIEAYMEGQTLAELCHLKPSPLPISCKGGENGDDIRHNQIKTSLKRLVGFSNGHERLVSWQSKEGLLAKLTAYCILLSENNEKDEKDLLGIQHYIDKAWQHGVQATQLFPTSQDNRVQFLSALEKMNQSIQRFAKHIARVITLFREDENVLFFLLRHRVQFEKIYSSRFIAKLFSQMFPKGWVEVKNILTTKYSQRGFATISSSIDVHIANLEGSTS